MMRRRSAITPVRAGVVALVLALATGAGVYFAVTSTQQGTTKTITVGSTTGSTTTSSTAHVTPGTFTYDVAETIQYLDPSVSFFSYDYNIMQNVYEPLIWFNGTCGTCVIPWLASSYTPSSDLKTYAFTLRSGIKFADGEPLNSTSVYFALNRIILEDGSNTVGHGTQASFLVQQLLNTSLSTTLCACAQTYDQKYADAVLAQNFVEVTGPLTFTIHVTHPNIAFALIFAGDMNSVPLPPSYTMRQDLTLWNAASAGYKLPYPSPTGTLANQIKQYFYDMMATCNAGTTPSGCGATYLDGSAQGSTAGTGPYTIRSVNPTTNTITLQSKSDYWGGPYQFSGGQKMVPKIQTVVLKYVQDQTPREIDLQNAAKSGQALAIDLEATNIYDVAERSTWLNQNKLVSDVPGASIFGPYTTYNVQFIHWVTNVTKPLTGQFYKFQPFADRRLRLAFSDGVNMTDVNKLFNNNLGVVANSAVPPGLPPSGVYDTTVKPAYKFDPAAVQNLLLDAMKNPLTKFRLSNGTLAKTGTFDNSFGCATLNSKKQCDNPVAQTIQLYFPTVY